MSSRTLALPARIKIRQLDDRPGRYPTNERTGDPGRTGNFSSFYDDTNTIVFTSGTTVSYPVMLPSASQYAQGLTSSISALGNVRKGISDAQIAFSHSEDILPFTEDGLYEQSRDPYFLTGTSDALVAGFSQRLASKIRIVIDLTPSATSSVGWTLQSSGSYDDTAQVPMAYFNFSRRVWEPMGPGFNAGDFSDGFLVPHPSSSMRFWSDPITSPAFVSARINDMVQSATLGFSRGIELMVSGVSFQCRPTSLFGFPSDALYHATASQVYAMSGVIRQPFLLEKFVYEFSGSYSIGSDFANRDRMFGYIPDNTVSQGGEIAVIDSGSHRASINTFFILNQRDNGFYRLSSAWGDLTFPQYVSLSAGTSSLDGVFQRNVKTPAVPVISKGGSRVSVNSARDLVTYGQVLSYYDGQGDSALPSFRTFGLTMDQMLSNGLSRELNISSSAPSTNWSGSFTMSGTCQQSPQQDESFTFKIRRSTPTDDSIQDYAIFSTDNVPGGRTMVQFGISGREIVNYKPGTRPSGLSGSLKDHGTDPAPGQGTVDTLDLTPSVVDVQSSPYLILPTDKLVFGWQPPMPLRWKEAVDAGSGPTLTLAPGKGRLVLYGTLIKAGQPYFDTLNQELTTEAVHEFTHHDNPVVDQFDIDNNIKFSSYVDEVVHGDFFSSGSDTRRVRGSSIQGTAGVTGALQLGVALVSENERYYDSVMPDIQTFMSASGVPVLKDIVFGRRGVPVVEFSGSVDNPLIGSRSFFLEGSVVTGTLTGSYRMPFPYVGDPKRNLFDAVSLKVTDMTSIAGPPATRSVLLQGSDLITAIFKVGHRLFQAAGTVGGSSYPRTNIFHSPVTGAEGFRYGIKNNSPEFTKCVFRTDRYGQFRDMLEQRANTIFYDTVGVGTDGSVTGKTGKTKSPIIVTFVNTGSFEVIDPTSTSLSSNVSLFSTSSRPYIDGESQN